MGLETVEMNARPGARFHLSTLFVATGALAAYFAIVASGGGMLAYILAGGLMVSLRLPLLFFTRCFWISIPALLLFLAIPITLEWDSIHNAWTTLNRPPSLANWLIWITMYMSYPVFAVITDSQYNYSTTKERYIRVATDIVLLSGWFFIYIAILVGMSHKN